MFVVTLDVDTIIGLCVALIWVILQLIMLLSAKNNTRRKKKK